jgi:ABC-2 type transport system permease protein
MVGLAAATLVAGWASEETSGRLEFLLAAPLSRVRWVLASAAGLLVDIFVVVALVGLGIGIGGATTGGDLLTPIIGSMVLVFYGGVLVGVGMAVGGLIGTRFAAPVTVLAVFLTWFLQLFGSLFDLPDFVQQLAITNHYGKPLVGVWDFGGIAASVVIAALGIVLAAWGFQRRDLRG